MTLADVSLRFLCLLWQASWQGALFAAAVGLACLLFRIPAPVRAWLWLLAGAKFFVGFLYLLLSGRGMALELPVPPPLMSSVSRAAEGQVAPFSFLALYAMAAWSAGVLLCVVFVVTRARATYKTMSGASPCPPETIPCLLSDLSNRIGVAPHHVPPVRIAPGSVEGPQVMLSGRRCIVILPESLLPPSPAALNETDLRFVIAHELAHIRRGDLWAGLLIAAMQTLFFFHPCAVWVKREWEAAREEACDLMALHACGNGDRDLAARYGALLLRLGSGSTAGSVASARIAASPFDALRRRLTHLRRHQTETGGRHSFAFALIALPLFAVLLLPVEPRWATTDSRMPPLKVAPQPAASASASNRYAKPGPNSVHSRSPRRTAPEVARSIKAESNKMHPSGVAAKRIPVVQPPLAQRRRLATTFPRKIVSVSNKHEMPIPSEPLQEAVVIMVKQSEAASVPAPLAVEPEITEDTIYPSPSLPVAVEASNSGTGAPPIPRSSATTTARIPVAAFDTRVVPRSGPVLSSQDSTRSRSVPIPIASPPTALTPSDSPIPESDATRPPRN